MGIQEILVILVIVVLLFGTPILTFLLGYLVGRKRAHDVVCDGESSEPVRDDSVTAVGDEEPEDE